MRAAFLFGSAKDATAGGGMDGSRRRGARFVEASVIIRRPVADVYAFYRDFRNLPRFLGDVVAVDVLDAVRSRWTVLGPFGRRVHWMTTVTAERADALIAYETNAPRALRTRWAVRFAAAGAGGTEVRERLSVPFGAVGRAVLRAVGKPPAEEIAANLNRLRQLLETGAVTDTRHAVRGRFGTPAPGGGSQD